MPLYDYACTKCGKIHEVRHGFGETHAEPCPACGGPLRRVFSPAPVVFKGSGFYVTDSRPKKSGKAPEKPAAPTSAPKADAPASTEPKAAAKPSEPAA